MVANLDEGRDRAKASEHAVFLRRILHAPVGKVVGTLTRVAEALTGGVSLMVPGELATPATLPAQLAISPCQGTPDWELELKLSSHDAAWHFFEGEIRFEDLPDQTTEAVLIGRFAWREQLLGRAEQNVMRDIAEENLIRIFEQIQREIESAIASAE